MLPSSKLLPLTIVGVVGVLSIKAYAVASTLPSRTALKPGLERAVAVAGVTASSSVITRANAAPGAAAPNRVTAENSEGAVPASGASRSVRSVGAQAGATLPSQPAGSAERAMRTVSLPDPPPLAAAAVSGATPVPAGVPQLAAAATSTASASDLAALGRGKTEDRERHLVEREATMAAAEKRLNERLSELVGLQQRLQELESGLKVRDEANWAGLVKLYEGMKPHEAAAIFNSLEKPVLLEIIDRMKPAKASPVIAAMESERARQVTADLAVKRTKSTTAAN